MLQSDEGAALPSIFHLPSIELAVAVNEASRQKFDKESNSLLRDALFVLSHDSVIVHRAVETLAANGWASPGAALLRTLLDMNISVLALAHAAQPQLAAFKFLYSGFRRHARDETLDAAARRHMRGQIRNRLLMLPDGLRAEAVKVVKDKDRVYWFAPEWSRPSQLVEQFGSKDLAWTYAQLSAASHGTFFGMRLFRENPDRQSVGPEPIGPRAIGLDLMSCRFLLSIAQIRNDLEALGMGKRIGELQARIRDAALGSKRDR